MRREYLDVRIDEVFWNIKKPDVNVYGDKSITDTCNLNYYSTFDINNDGVDEKIIKRSFCLSGIQSDNIYVYDIEKGKLNNADDNKILFKFVMTGKYYNLDEISINQEYPKAIGSVYDISAYRLWGITPSNNNLWGNNKTFGQYFIRISSVDVTDKYINYHVIAKVVENNLEDYCYYKIID